MARKISLWGVGLALVVSTASHAQEVPVPPPEQPEAPPITASPDSAPPARPDALPEQAGDPVSTPATAEGATQPVPPGASSGTDEAQQPPPVILGAPPPPAAAPPAAERAVKPVDAEDDADGPAEAYEVYPVESPPPPPPPPPLPSPPPPPPSGGYYYSSTIAYANVTGNRTNRFYYLLESIFTTLGHNDARRASELARVAYFGPRYLNDGAKGLRVQLVVDYNFVFVPVCNGRPWIPGLKSAQALSPGQIKEVKLSCPN